MARRERVVYPDDLLKRFRPRPSLQAQTHRLDPEPRALLDPDAYEGFEFAAAMQARSPTGIAPVVRFRIRSPANGGAALFLEHLNAWSQRTVEVTVFYLGMPDPGNLATVLQAQSRQNPGRSATGVPSTANSSVLSLIPVQNFRIEGNTPWEYPRTFLIRPGTAVELDFTDSANSVTDVFTANAEWREVSDREVYR